MDYSGFNQDCELLKQAQAIYDESGSLDSLKLKNNILTQKTDAKIQKASSGFFNALKACTGRGKQDPYRALYEAMQQITSSQDNVQKACERIFPHLPEDERPIHLQNLALTIENQYAASLANQSKKNYRLPPSPRSSKKDLEIDPFSQRDQSIELSKKFQKSPKDAKLEQKWHAYLDTILPTEEQLRAMDPSERPSVSQLMAKIALGSASMPTSCEKRMAETLTAIHKLQPVESRRTMFELSHSIDRVAHKSESKEHKIETFSPSFCRVLESVFQACPEIKEVKINHLALNDESAKNIFKALNTLPHLQTLDLSESNLGKRGVDLLTNQLIDSQCQIEKLTLRKAGLDSSAAKTLAQGLESNQSLKTLILTENPLSDEGAKAVLHAAQFNTRLSTLNLRQTSITKDSVDELQTTLQRRRPSLELNLTKNKLSSEDLQSLTPPNSPHTIIG